MVYRELFIGFLCFDLLRARDARLMTENLLTTE